MKALLRIGSVIGLLLIIFGCEFVGSNGSLQSLPEPAPLPDSISEAYHEDAKQLALRQLVEEDPDRIEIPDTLVNRYFKALAHVYHARHIDARDSIVGIHTFPRYNPHEIIVGVDSTAEWTEAWRNGERMTGNAAIDTLIEQYDLTLDNYLAFAPAAVLRSEESLNPIALSSEFEGVAGVRYAEQNGYSGDGNDIRAELQDEALLLHYSRAWGDCPAGCIHRTTWTFRIDGSGTVSFVEKTSN